MNKSKCWALIICVIICAIFPVFSHPNTDISVGVVDLLQELTDVDILHESLQGCEILIDELRKMYKPPYKGVLDLVANRFMASGTNAWTDTDHTCYTMTTAGNEGKSYIFLDVAQR
jgi:hypothetical protein